jgi:hypothetical protein
MPDPANVMRVLRDRALEAEIRERRAREQLRIVNGRVGGLQSANSRLQAERLRLLCALTEVRQHLIDGQGEADVVPIIDAALDEKEPGR